MKRILFFMALLAVVILGVLQQRALARRRAEHETLLKDSAEAQRLKRENEGLAQLPGVDAEVKALRQNQRELARLRNEVSQLRAQSAEAAKLREIHQNLVETQSNLTTGAMPPGFISRAELADRGLGSPEAAVETLFYAMCQGNVQRALQCQGTQDRQNNLTPEQEANTAEDERHQFADFKGYFIVHTDIVSPDEENVGIAAIPGGAVLPLDLERHDGEWHVK